MKKKDKDSWDYILSIPYSTDKELDEIIDEIIGEANYIADMHNGHLEMDVREPATGKSW